VGRSRAGEVHQRVGDVSGHTLVRQRLQAGDGGFVESGVDVGGDVRRGDGVDPYAMCAELDRQTSGGVGDSRLGHPVRQHADAWRDTGARGHVHDRSTAMGSHVTRRGLGGQQHAEKVDRDHPLEVAKVVVEKAAQTARDPSDVADHIKAAEAFHGRSDQSLDLRRVRHIGLHELGTLTELLDDLRACLTDVGDNHERSGRDESLRRDASDALSRTRDDRHHAVVLTPHATALPTFDPSIREPNFPDDSAVSHLTNTRE